MVSKSAIFFPECTKLPKKIQNSLEKILSKTPLIGKIVDAISEHGGRALLVGGAVRDLLLSHEQPRRRLSDQQIDSKDLDIEVHGISLAKLERLLRQFGPVNKVGKAFGVLRLHLLDIDWSLPRQDSPGRKPKVTFHPTLSYQEAFARRDFTINAIGIDLHDYVLIDPFNGQTDLTNRLLRSPDINFFEQDPLRFYRVMQFIGRFNMHVDKTLQHKCMSMDIRDVSRERIVQEFSKLFLKSSQPSRGIRWLNDIGRLAEILPELAQTINIPQDPRWHPEGDVFEHTMQSIDAAARVIHTTLKNHEPAEKLLLIYTLLAHDLGKTQTTEFVDGAYHSYGHEKVSAAHARTLLKRIAHSKQLIDHACILVKYHMAPGNFIHNNVAVPAYKRLAHTIEPLTLRMLGYVMLCDMQGRNGKSSSPITTINPLVKQFFKKAQRAGVLDGAEKPLLQGGDLLDHVSPGKHLGNLLRYAYRLQTEEGITDKRKLRAMILSRISHNKKRPEE